jgi:hypothetical protein
MRREHLFKAGLVAGGTIAALLLVEAGFRVAGWQQGVDYRLYLKELKNSDRLPRVLFRADPMTKAVLVPNTKAVAVTSDFSVVYSINRHGLRDQDYDDQPPPGVVRILALGDSQTFGEGVAYGQRFTDIPEQEIPGLEILTAAVPGWGTESELVYLARDGVRLRPDWVVVFISLLDTKRTVPGLVIRDGKIELPEVSTEPPPAAETWYLQPDDPLFEKSGFFARNSYAISYALFRYAIFSRQESLEQDDAARWKGKGPREQDGSEIGYGGSITKAPRRLELVLRTFVDIAREQGFRLMFVNISGVASLDYIPKIDPGIVYHDLAPELAELSKTQRLFFKYDRHFNPDAHAWIGHRLTEILRPVVEEARKKK